MSTGQQIRYKTLVRLIRCPLWRNLPFTPFHFWSLPVRWRLFQLSTAINHGQHVVCPSVHLHLSFTCWLVRASRTGPFQVGQCQLLAHYDCTPPKDLTFNGGEPTPCLTFSHAIRVLSIVSLNFFMTKRTRRRRRATLQPCGITKKAWEKVFFSFFHETGTPTPFSMKLAQGGNGYFWNEALFCCCYCCLLIDSHLVPPVSVPKDDNNENQWKIWDCECCNETVKNQWRFRGAGPFLYKAKH